MKREQNIGKHGQLLAASTLAGLGIVCLESIGTPVKLIPASATRRDIYRVIFGEKVAGDHHGLLNGRGVLIETKTILDRNLRYSDFREHQPEKLTQWANNKGMSLVVWVHNSGVYVMEFPIEGFVFRSSLTVEQAAELDRRTRAAIAARVEEAL